MELSKSLSYNFSLQLKDYDRQTADWSQHMREKRLLSPVTLVNWMLVFTNQQANLAEDFTQVLINVCGRMGIKIHRPAK